MLGWFQQTKAQELCQKTYGNTPLKQANTLPAITELKTFYAQGNQPEDQETRQKIQEALVEDGFAAWIIPNAIKRNNGQLPERFVVYRFRVSVNSWGIISAASDATSDPVEFCR